MDRVAAARDLSRLRHNLQTKRSPLVKHARRASASGARASAPGQPYTLAYRLHAGGIGFIALCRKPGLNGHPLWQRCLKLPQLIGSLPKRGDEGDWYIGVNAFKRPSRKLDNLVSLRANFLDLDTYNLPAWDGCRPKAIWARILELLKAEGIPQPNVAVFSGRGIQLYWVYREGLPAAALPRWRAVQEHLAKKLSVFGPDMGALDAARVLRLPGTVNTKSGLRAYLLHVDLESAMDFDELAQCVLPLDRYALRAKRENGRVVVPRIGTSRREAAARHVETILADIRRLIDRRWSGWVPEGFRNATLFVFGSYLVRRVGIVALPAALAEFGSAVCDLDHEELEQIAASITRKIANDSVGYRFGPAGAARWLDVTVEEVRAFGLVRLHPPDPVLTEERRSAQRQRDLERKRQRRLAAGARPHQESAERTKPWGKLGLSRTKYYRLGHKKNKVKNPGETILSSTTDGGTPRRTVDSHLDAEE
jgi:hypothetical protein